MATVPLPAQPNLDHLRGQARDLQRAVRSGDRAAAVRAGIARRDGPAVLAPGYPLTRAQLVVAREYGFASWARLRHHVDALTARSWVHSPPDPHESAADRYLRLACLNYADDRPSQWRAAEGLLRANPELAEHNLAVAAVAADVDQVERHLARDAAASTTPTGPHRWSPLMYAAYARVNAELDATLTMFRLLLEAGADPNDGRLFLGLPTPFTVLTGVLGGGESNPPPHQHSIPVARLLLSHGADPNDGQALYNRMFTDTDDFLVLLFEFGLGTGDGGPWRRLLPDLIPAPTDPLRRLLEWAVDHDQRDRIALLAGQGVDLVAPLGHGRTPIEQAARNGYRELVASLHERGVTAPKLPPVDAFIAAALAGDDLAVAATPPAVIAAARQARPALVVWAAAQGHVDAVELLVAAGFDVNAFGSNELDGRRAWQTALHSAVERNESSLVDRLLELGAERDLRDRRFDATPADWARHLGHSDLADRL